MLSVYMIETIDFYRPFPEQRVPSIQFILQSNYTSCVSVLREPFPQHYTRWILQQYHVVM